VERVRAAANELGYTPNAAAQNLRGKKISTVLILLSSNSLVYGVSQVVPQVLEGVSQVLAEKNIRIQFLNRYRSETADQHIIDLAYSGAIHGAIAISPDIPTIGGRSLAGAGIPTIALLADHSGVGIASVVTDDRAAMCRAAVHLLELGHRTFFYISGFRGNYHTDERFAGLWDAALSSGVEQNAICRFEHDLQFQEGFKVGEQAAQAFLALKRRPTAVLACSDDAAIAFMAVIRRAGLGVPEAVSVVGFDGAPVGPYCEPPLTTLGQPTIEMGRKAAMLLLDELHIAGTARRRGAKARILRHVVESTLILRASTGPASDPSW